MTKILRLIAAILLFASYFVIVSADCIAATKQGPDNIQIVRRLYSDNQYEDFFNYQIRISVFIPEVRGLSNTDLQARINDRIREYILSRRIGGINGPPTSTLWGDFEVTFYNGNLLGINFVGNTYGKGAAHPIKIDEGFHIDLTNGEVYELKDLFKEGTDYKSRIRELCFQNQTSYRLSSKYLWNGWTYDTFARSWEGTNFLASADTVVVYDSLNFATGYYPGYGVPYSDLADIINTDGAFWKAIHRKKPITLKAIPEELTADDFVIQGIRLGDSAESVVAKLGEPKSKTQDQDGYSYNYGYSSNSRDYQVIFDAQNTVVNFIIERWSVHTRRNITAGMPIDLALSRYGENVVKTSFSDYDLYEYAISSSPKQQYILRFAVKQGTTKIDYIGCRISAE